VLATTEETVALHPFTKACELVPDSIHRMIEQARNGVSAVSQSLHG
jgi:hypothetical protein